LGPISGRFTEKWPKSNRFFRGGLWPRRDDCYFARGGKVTKTPPGVSFDEHMACASVHRRRPPGPPIYGGVSLWPLCNPRRAKSRPVSVLFSAHWGLLPSKFVSAYFYRTPPPASLPVWCGGGRPRQLPSCHGYAGVGGARTAQTLLNFCPVGACAPEARRTTDLVFARREAIINPSGRRPP